MHRILKICCVISIVVFGGLLSGCEKSEEAEFQDISLEELDVEGTSRANEEIENPDESKIFVHVCGEVKIPGVYELEAGNRIFEAIEAAGGMTKAAAGDSVNQAEILIDGQQLYVPSKEEIQKQNDKTSVTDKGKVNINKASKDELMTLAGIGEAKANAIIRYREENGAFKSIEEIMEIEGIKEGIFRKIEDQITVS
mgnify:CR=1 FL=1